MPEDQVSNGAAGASGAEAPMWRDRDPPPNFDGDVEGFNQYVRDLKLWRHDTDVPERKHGVKVLRGLSGQAKAICNELSVEELTSTGSVDLILAKLREHYSPHLETTMPKAFEKAVYGEPRKPKESICDFVIRQDAAFRELHEEGVQLSDEVKGYILYRQSNLTQVQEDQITTWTQGKFARSDVVKALRKLEKIQKEKPGSRYMTVEDETFMTEPIEGGSDDSGDYVYLGEDDLNHIYEEEEIQEALATYQQVRKAIQEQKNNRGYYGPGVSGKGLGKSSKGKTSIKFSSKGTKVHVDLLKLRTKCARCGQVGHWAKECINEPDARAKNRAAASSTGTSSPKAGFFEVGEHTTMNVNDTYQVTLGQFIKKGQNRSSFVGLTTSSHVGIIDTAAQGGLIGRRALDRLGEELRKHRLKVQWSTKQAQARGIGGEARVVGVVEIPVGIAGVNGLIEATVVEEDVPFLLSIKFLQQVKATISLSEQELHLGAFGRSTKLQEMPTGHVAVDVLQFEAQGWSLPTSVPLFEERKNGFHFLSTAPLGLNSSFMWNSTKPHLRLGSIADGSLQSHGQDRANGFEIQCGKLSLATQPRARHSSLAHSDGKGGRSHGAGKSSGQSQRLAGRWIRAWLACAIVSCQCTPSIGILLTAGNHSHADLKGNGLCGDDQAGQLSGTSQVQESAFHLRGDVLSPSDLFGGCGKSDTERSLVQAVPCSLAGGSTSHETSSVQDASGAGGKHHDSNASRTTSTDLQHQGTHHAAAGHEPSSDSTKEAGISSSDSSQNPVASHELSGESTSSKFTGRHSSEDHPTQCGDVQVRRDGHPASGEEVRTNARPIVLEVRPKSVRFLRRGSGGNQETPGGADETGGGAQSPGIRTSHREREERSHQPDDGYGRAASPGIDVGSARPPRDGKGDASELTPVDDSAGGRRKDGTSIPRSEDPAGSCGEGHDLPPDDDSAGINGIWIARATAERGSDGGLRSILEDDVNEVVEEENHQEPPGVPDERMSCWIKENAPRVCELKNAAQWNLWAKKQIEEEEPSWRRQVASHWWLKYEPQGRWQFHQGILPSKEAFPKEAMAMGIFMGEQWEDHHESGKDKALSKASRKAILKQMKKLTVAEVFSPPRVTTEAKEMGHQEGGAFDLHTGYDLSQRKDRVRCWQELRQADPHLVVICPPCSPFSLLQELNRGRVRPEVWHQRLSEGQEHVSFGMKIYEWQVRRGRLAIFEHPSTSKAWQEPSVQRVLSLPGVRRIRADQCQYGLAVKGEPNKKPTDFMVNGEALARHLSKRCTHQHRHQPLVGGIARFAQEYPKKLCQAMIKGAEEDATHLEIWAAEEIEGSEALERALDEDLERQEGIHVNVHARRAHPEEEKGQDDEEDPTESGRGLTRQEKAMIHKLQCNLGHPGKADFCKALRMARARSAVWTYVKNEYKCDVCEAHPRPKSARPAALPRSFEPAKNVGIDVVFFPGVDVRTTRPVLNMVDWATGFQLLEPLQNMQSDHLWQTFMSTWVRIFGVPECVVVDQGREFGKDFAEKLGEAGAVLKVIGARAPWQQGRTERHGGLAKEIFTKLREDAMPSNDAEWKNCIHALEAAKNRLFNRSGYSPAQRQLGQNIRLPASLGSDDVYDPTLVLGAAGGDMQRLLHTRQLAMEAFIKHTTSTAIHRASHARSRTVQSFSPGDIVYVYRVPLQRKRAKHDDSFEDKEGRRPTWVGPGTIVMTEGGNAWLSIRGELWKCAKEQLRKATEEELQAKDLLEDEFEELKRGLSRKESKRGFKDVTHWELPPIEDDEPPWQRRRIDSPAQETVEEEEEYEPTSPPSTASAEPEEEAPGSQPVPSEVISQAVNSHARCEALDGTLHGRTASQLYGPNLASRWAPYRGGVAVRGDDDAEDDHEGEDRTEDLWVFDPVRQSIIRKHLNERGTEFVPSNTRGCPVPLKFLTSQRNTVKILPDGVMKIEKSHWRNEGTKPKKEITQWWTGYTEFKLRKIPHEVTMMVKRGSDEVREEDIPEEEWEQWRVSDGAEWSKVHSTGAVKVLSEEESHSVEHQLAEAGLSARILPSRIVRRWKKSEQPGEPPTRKSRWCIRGDQDPDILDLLRHAPTITTSTLSVVLQIGTSQGWKAAVGDLRNAFMQSDKLERTAGRLYCRQPKGGLPGLSPHQLIEVIAGVYGLGDAPAHWRRSLKKVLFQLGFVQSGLDPCVYKLFKGNQLAGLLVVEVGDLFGMGNEEFFEVMEVLRGRFQFGKFVFLQEQVSGAAFNGRRLKQLPNGEIQVDMEKFVKEKLEEVKLDSGRASQPKSKADSEEKDRTRAAVGSLTWAAKEGRPDAAAMASLVASCLNDLKIQDILDLNKAIRNVRKEASLCIRIQPIAPEDIAWGVFTDASYANASKGRSQGAFAVVALDKKTLTEGKGKCNLLHWRSGKIHRVVNSTLAAETQALSRGMSELSWTVTVYNEFSRPDFNMKEWEKHLKDRSLQALVSQESTEELKRGIKNVGIVDAKSLYDHLSKEGIGATSDKRTALEMQVIRQTLAETGSEVRWIPHPKMVVDCLTKREGNSSPLYELLQSGQLNLFLAKRNFLGAVEVEHVDQTKVQ